MGIFHFLAKLHILLLPKFFRLKTLQLYRVGFFKNVAKFQLLKGYMIASSPLLSLNTGLVKCESRVKLILYFWGVKCEEKY
jgi:hypothetical protein